MTAADLEERIPSGRAKTFQNRVGWAATYLYRTGLLERPARSQYRITERGRHLLQAHPHRIDLAVLDQFPEFREFRDARKKREPTPLSDEPSQPATTTPEETIDAAYPEHREALALELTDWIRQQSPAFFERLVLDVLLATGYGGSRAQAAQRLGRSGDGGLDGVIWEDRLGLDLIYVQAKRWKQDSTVGRPEVQGFVGALQGARAPKGVLSPRQRSHPRLSAMRRPSRPGSFSSMDPRSPVDDRSRRRSVSHSALRPEEGRRGLLRLERGARALGSAVPRRLFVVGPQSLVAISASPLRIPPIAPAAAR